MGIILRLTSCTLHLNTWLHVCDNFELLHFGLESCRGIDDPVEPPCPFCWLGQIIWGLAGSGRPVIESTYHMLMDNDVIFLNIIIWFYIAFAFARLFKCLPDNRGGPSLARCNSSTAPEKKFHCKGLFKKDGGTICIIEPFLPHSHRPWDAELHTVCRHSFLKQMVKCRCFRRRKNHCFCICICVKLHRGRWTMAGKRSRRWRSSRQCKKHSCGLCGHQALVGWIGCVFVLFFRIYIYIWVFPKRIVHRS